MLPAGSEVGRAERSKLQAGVVEHEFHGSAPMLEHDRCEPFEQRQTALHHARDLGIGRLQAMNGGPRRDRDHTNLEQELSLIHI